MKNEKNILKKILVISIIILILGIVGAPKAFALKRVIFPDEKLLQPIPPAIHPNISGNVNNTLNPLQLTPSEGPQPSQKNNTLETLPQSQDETIGGKNLIFYKVWFLIILVIILIYIFFFKKPKQKIITANKSETRGFSLIEVVIACSIITIIILTTMSAAQNSLRLSSLALRQTQANFLLEEGAEAVRSIRDTSWTTISNLTLDTDYYLSYDTNSNIWSLGVTPNTVDSFTRKVVISAVNRNSNDDIISLGTLDTGTKKIIITVSWPSSNGTISRTLSFYLANILN